MTHQTSNIQFTNKDYTKVFETLLSSDNGLKSTFENYLEEEYEGDNSLRLNYIDIAEISREIIAKQENGETGYFGLFFTKVEEILQSCDSEIENLIVIGLFESIQNNCGRKINYYSGYDKWLKPLSKSRWFALIDFWEGNKWRNSKKRYKKGKQLIQLPPTRGFVLLRTTKDFVQLGQDVEIIIGSAYTSFDVGERNSAG